MVVRDTLLFYRGDVKNILSSAEQINVMMFKIKKMNDILLRIVLLVIYCLLIFINVRNIMFMV